MSTIAIRKSAVAGMTALQRRLLRIVCERIELVEPSEFATPGNVRWYVFDDPRISLKDVAILGRFSAAMANAPDVETREELYDWMKDTIVLPKDVPMQEGDNPWQKVLAANGAPAALQANASVPATWVPADGGDE